MAASVSLVVKPEMIAWACERSGRSLDELRKKFPKLDRWRSGETPLTLAELKRFATATYTAFGQFFDDAPPSDALPISDLRNGPGSGAERPSPHLLDTIRDCQFSQLWYREHLLDDDGGADPLPFIAAVDPSASPKAVAARYAAEAKFAESREEAASWDGAFRRICTSLRGMGVLVFINGVVGANTHRPLDPAEFRGFALADPIAPLIFINGRDVKAAQMFTLAHEFAHLLLGDSGLDDLAIVPGPSSPRERWCDAVAAEMLVPQDDLVRRFRDTAPIDQEVVRTAQHYKVSRLVILRRLRTADLIETDEYRDLYQRFYSGYRQPDLLANTGTSGGDFYKTLLARYGRDYATAVVSSTLAGTTSYTDMTALLGFKSLDALDKFASELGVAG